MNPWTVVCQAPLSMGFSRLEYRSVCHSLLQRIFLTQGNKTHSTLKMFNIMFTIHSLYIDEYELMGSINQKTFLKWSHFNYHFVLFIYFLFYFFISWRLITLQYCSGFCHTLKWISHGFTCVPPPDPPSHLPLHLLPLGLPSAPGLSTCLMHPTWAGDLFHPR